MNINFILNKIIVKVPYLEKIISALSFEHIQNVDLVVFLQGKTIFYTDKLFINFTDEEQAFIIAHEIMHYFFHQNVELEYLSKMDKDMINFVEDAQINQLLIKLNFKAPKGVVLLKDALDYKIEELYKILMPMRKVLLREDNWSNYTTINDILNNDQLNTDALVSKNNK